MGRSGFRIGKIFGIEIRVDWSLLFIFILITWNLSTVFNEYHSDWSPAGNIGLAVTGGILFFASVLAHELAHALVARRRGIPIRRITLFLFGGVANIEREPNSPKDEFLMAVVGPVVSLVVGGFLVWLAGVFVGPVDTTADPYAFIGQLNPFTTLILWLGSINLILGVFNLIPGFPLDGGRILRSILWSATNSLRRATRWASWAGQAIAWLFIGLGIAMAFGVTVPFFGSGLLNGLWLAFIGWFLNSAAVQSYQQLVIRDLLDDVPVQRLMRAEPPTVSQNILVDDLVDSYIMKTDDYAFPVTDAQGELVGLVTLNDVRAIPRTAWNTTRVQEIMTPAKQLVVTYPREDTTHALNKLARNAVRQLPVVQEAQLVGLLRRRDIVKWLQLQSEFGFSQP
jgi:Zn-dependent protease